MQQLVAKTWSASQISPTEHSVWPQAFLLPFLTDLRRKWLPLF